MPQTLSRFIIFLFISAFICSCHSTPKVQEQSGFKNIKSVTTAIKGSWVLQEYADSIDAGLTPKLVEYLMQDFYAIDYDHDTCYFITGFSKSGSAGHDDDRGNISTPVGIGFIPGTEQVIFKKLVTSEDPRFHQSDTAELIITNGDTLLQIGSDSAAKRFIKYDGNRCEANNAYLHLVNSRFIAGQYYNVNDPARAHHIIFTKCGIIEGVESIDSILKGHNKYDIKLDHFSDGENEMYFFGTDSKSNIRYSWEMDKDSLKLSPVIKRKGQKPILLVKK